MANWLARAQAALPAADLTRSALLAMLPQYRWRVSLPEGGELEVCGVPELTAAEVSQRYPEALSIQPMVSTPRRQATSAEAAELAALIASVYLSGPPEEQAEALTIALADPTSSLPCYRALAHNQNRKGEKSCKSY